MSAVTDRMIEDVRAKASRVKRLFGYLENGPGWTGMGVDAGKVNRKSVARECRQLARLVAKLERRALVTTDYHRTPKEAIQ